MTEAIVPLRRSCCQRNTDPCKSSFSLDTRLGDVLNTSLKQQENDDALHNQRFQSRRMGTPQPR